MMKCVYMFLASSITFFTILYFRHDDEVKSSKCQNKYYIVEPKGGSRHKNLCMTRVLGFLIRYFSNYYTLHRSDLAAQAAPLDPRLEPALFGLIYKKYNVFTK